MAEQSHADLTPLSAATVQQIQFELFRRSAVSVEYGYLVQPIIDVLRTRADLWTGMVIDRIHLGHRGHGLLPMTMIPLRDVSQNFWNADTPGVTPLTPGAPSVPGPPKRCTCDRPMGPIALAAADRPASVTVGVRAAGFTAGDDTSDGVPVPALQVTLSSRKTQALVVEHRPGGERHNGVPSRLWRP